MSSSLLSTSWRSGGGVLGNYKINMTYSNNVYRLRAVGVVVVCLILMIVARRPQSVIGGETIRAGIIGCDTSHSLAFTKILNSSDVGDSYANVRVVAVFPGGSEDIASSRDRVGKFAEELGGMGVVVARTSGCRVIGKLRRPKTSRTSTPSDGRRQKGVHRQTSRGISCRCSGNGAIVFREKSNTYVEGFDGYEALVGQIAKFFKTGIPPVSAEETLAIFAFMEAADESKRQGGVSVTLESVLAKARAEAAARK